MTSKQLVELIETHFPNEPKQKIRTILSQVYNDFLYKTRLHTHRITFTTVKDQRNYDLFNAINSVDNREISEIEKVTIEGVEISRLVGEPETEDLT